MDLEKLTIQEANKGLREKKFSAQELTSLFLSQIDDKDKGLGAYLEVDREEALVQAARVDALIAEGKPIHYLTGVPLAIKDNILIRSRQATAGSKILENYTAAYDATVIKNLKKEEAIFLGKTNLDEFAMGSSTENSAYQVTKNPHDKERVPGGSSGGSAVAVAANMALGALGSDTGGSIRQPASFCGVVGLKPTYVAVSRFGLIALASSLDQIGTLSKTVEDSAIVFDAIKGSDEHDATSDKNEYGATAFFDDDSAKKLTIGVPKEYFSGGMEKETEAEINNALHVFKKNGFTVKKISLPHTKHALSCYYIIMPAEASANLARFDGVRYERNQEAESLPEIYKKTRGSGFGNEPKRRILLGTFVLSSGYYDAFYAKAQKARQLIADDFKRAFAPADYGVDVIFTPTSPTRAFKIGEKTEDPVSMYLSDIFTVPVNLVGLPGLSIPVKKYVVGSGELPVGFQLIGKRFHEKDILNLGMWYE